MDLGLAGRSALVTGGTRGIGLAITRTLVAERARVATVARGEEGLQAVELELGVVGVRADLATEEGCVHAYTEAVRLLGPLEILVNNVGGRAGSRWDDTGPAEFEQALATNLLPALRLSKLAVPGMAEALH